MAPAGRPAQRRPAPLRRLARRPGYGTDPVNETSGTLPYIGIGYSNLSPRSGWSFSADLGLVSLRPATRSASAGVFGGSQNLDDVVRDMRLTPLVQLGVSYSSEALGAAIPRSAGRLAV